MKKFLIISLFVFWLIFTGCSQQKRTSQDELFLKKKECASYMDNVKKMGIRNIQHSRWNGYVKVFRSNRHFL